MPVHYYFAMAIIKNISGETVSIHKLFGTMHHGSSWQRKTAKIIPLYPEKETRFSSFSLVRKIGTRVLKFFRTVK